MIEVISYPESPNPMMLTLFLGGSTAKGDWQKVVQDRVQASNINVVNTSRPDWDIAPPDESERKEHVEWEMNELALADYRFIYIPADAKSPTVLLELGLTLGCQRGLTWVAVDKDYPWYTNVVEACFNFDIEIETFEDALDSMVSFFVF